MANGQGGARIGAGRKKKALADNLADGNPGKRKLTVLDFTDSAADLEGQTMPPPKAFLAAKQKNGKDLLAMEVYEETWKWLAERNCAQLIPAQILEQYAMAISRWIQCEECITEYGFLAKHPTTGNAMAMALEGTRWAAAILSSVAFNSGNAGWLRNVPSWSPYFRGDQHCTVMLFRRQ